MAQQPMLNLPAPLHSGSYQMPGIQPTLQDMSTSGFGKKRKGKKRKKGKRGTRKKKKKNQQKE